MAKKRLYKVHYRTAGIAKVRASDPNDAVEKFERNPAKFVKVKDMVMFEYRAVDEKPCR